MYMPWKEDKPAGTDTPPFYSADDLQNIRALRDAVVCGFMPGWSYELDTASPPLFTIWSKGTKAFRMTLTYGPGTPSYCDSALWEYSENSGGSWEAITTGGVPCAITTDAIGSILTVDKDAGMWVLALSAFNRNRYSEFAGEEHAALIGEQAHGLGTLSTQDANAVAITGGSIVDVDAEGLTRLSPALPPALIPGAVWDWADTPTHSTIVAGASVASIANDQHGEMKRLEVLGAGAITLNGVTWATGHPTWGAVGTLVNVISVNNGTTLIATSIPF